MTDLILIGLCLSVSFRQLTDTQVRMWVRSILANSTLLIIQIMNVLWISNVLFPEICEELQAPTPVVGGWMEVGAKGLLALNQDIQMAVAALYSGRELLCVDKFRIRYYLIPAKVWQKGKILSSNKA